MRKTLFALSIFILFVTVTFSYSFAAEQGFPVIKSEKFKLYPGKKNNPFSILIPLNLKYYGEVRISVNIKSISEGKKKLYSNRGILRSLFLDRAYKNNSQNKIAKRFRLKEHFFSKTKKSMLKYYIDEPEIGKTKGDYEYMLSNMTNATIRGVITYSYPGSSQESKESKDALRDNLPDLSIKRIFLNNNNKIVVSVVNNSKHPLPSHFWNAKGKNACQIYLVINKKPWGGVTLQGFDQNKRLQKKDKVVNFVTNYVVTKNTRVTATIDSLSVVKEKDENNNRLTTILKP